MSALAIWSEQLDSLRNFVGSLETRRCFVLTCTGSRVPVEDLLDVEPHSLQLFPTAGGLATDEAIRAAAFAIRFGGVNEIVIIGHTGCTMVAPLSASATRPIREGPRGSIDETAIGSVCPDSSADANALCQADTFRRHPMIPKHLPIRSYVYDATMGTLRKAREASAYPGRTRLQTINSP